MPAQALLAAQRRETLGALGARRAGWFAHTESAATVVRRALAVARARLAQLAGAVALETSRALLACGVALAAVTRVAVEVDALVFAYFG